MFARLIRAAMLVCLVTLMAAPAAAQNTIAIYADFGDGLDPAGVTKVGEPFDVVVVTETYQGVSAIEFVMTELMHLYPGVFKLSTSKVNNTPLDLGDNQRGEYILAVGGCTDSGVNEMVRIRYYDVDGSLGDNIVLSLSGFGPGNSQVSSFDGQMGFIDCGGRGFVLAGRPWEHGNGVDPTRIDGVTVTDGILILNPVGLGVPNDAKSISTLKTSF